MLIIYLKCQAGHQWRVQAHVQLGSGRKEYTVSADRVTMTCPECYTKAVQWVDQPTDVSDRWYSL